MKLVLTALIDFNDEQDSDQESDDVSLNRDDGSRLLIDSQSLIAKLESGNESPVLDTDEYYKSLMTATLRFNDLSFRRRYFDWIYSRYSKSTTNRRRVQHNERVVLLDWAKQFNHEHRQLKILEIKPDVDNHNFTARLKMIGYSQPFGQTSFDFRNALEAEYNQNYDQAFVRLERDESRRLAEILETTFEQYVPDADFQFVSQDLDSRDAGPLKPVKFNPEWINQQQQKSEATAQTTMNQLQSAYNSVLSSADARSASDSRVITKLNQRLKARSNEQASLAASKSQAVAGLRSRIKAFSSNKSLVSQSVIKSKRSLMSQLSKVQSHAASYYSEAVSASSRAASANQQAKALSSARSMQKRLRSKASSQASDNHQLSSQAKTFSSNAATFRKASVRAKHSFASQLSVAKSSLGRTFFSAESVSASAEGLHQSLSSLSAKLSKTTSLSNLNVATNAKIINNLKVQNTSASSSTSNYDERSEADSNSSSSTESSVSYTSDYNYASSVKHRSFSAERSLSFAQSVTVDKGFSSASSLSTSSEAGSSQSSSAKSSKPEGKWGVAMVPNGKWGIAKRRNYIPTIIVISIIIIILLILIFPLLKF